MVSAAPIARASRRLGDALWGREPPAREGLPEGLGYTMAWGLYRWVTDPIGILDEVADRAAFTMYLAGVGPIVGFQEPEAIKEIFTGPNDEMSAGQANRALESVLGRYSMLILDGPPHLRQRRLLSPSFHGERMQAYGADMRDITAARVADWPEGEPFPVAEETQRITLDVILRTVFGVNEGPEAERLRVLITRLTGSARSPVWLLPPFQRDLGPLTPYRRIVTTLRAIDDVLYPLIYRVRREGRRGRQDILSLMVEARDEEGRPMTPVELRDELMTMLTAGHETTATSLAWCFHRLFEHPECHARIREELEEVYGGGPVDPGESHRLVYLDGFIRETLRLDPIIPFVGRRLLSPMRIGGYDLPRGVVAAPCIYLTHRNPRVWPDPERFDPTRFVGTRVSPYAFLPFGGGIRRCLGMAFALYEMRLVLATILAAVDVEPAPDHVTRLVRRGITFAPSDGMPIVARRRAR